MGFITIARGLRSYFLNVPQRFAGFRRQRRFATGLAIACLLGLSPTLADTAFATRGWAAFSEGTLLSDNGSPLRGPRYALDFFQGSPPPAGWIEGLPSRGINALHVYAESTLFTAAVGDNVAGLDDIIARAAASDIYVVITVGGFPLTADWEQFALDFWTFYGPRYSQHSHVIFELQNEAWFECDTSSCTAQPSPSNILDFEADAYRIARTAAPQTPILFFSYAFLHSGSGVLTDIAGLEQRLSNKGQVGIDWAKAGIAFHGYTGAVTTENALRQVTPHGYGLVETELQPCPSCGGDLEIPLVIAYETTRTSWFSFLPWNKLNDTFWDNVLNAAFVVWAADEGDWPGTSAPPIGSEVAIRSPVGSGAYLRVDLGSRQLIADANTVTSASIFEVEAMGRYISLKSKANGQYVQRGSDNRLRANSASPAAFEWIDLPDGQVVLQAKSNWHFVTANYNLTPPFVMADRPLPSGAPIMVAAWERFEVEVVIPSHTLTVQRVGSGSGTVTSSPGGISCGNDCTEDYAEGTAVSLQAVAGAGSTFVGWGGDPDCAGGNLTMTGNRSCIATFQLIDPACGGLFQEAENGDLVGGFVIDTEGSRTYIEVPDLSVGGAQPPRDTQKASYCVTVPTTGTYRVEGQVRAPGFAADSFYVRFDGQGESLWIPRPLGNWVTDLVNDTRVGSVVDPVEYFLTAGEHTLDILLREDGTQLDSFQLVEVTPPSDCGGLTQEAEDGELSPVFQIQTEGSRTYIEVPDLSVGGPQPPRDHQKASYCVTVPTMGTYRVEGQVRAPGFAADSFYVRFDGQSESLWVPRPLGNWTTDWVNDTRGSTVVDPVEFFLTTGEHTLDILLREDGTQLDSFTLIQQ
ncbi:MAG: hypothetical protein K0U98_26405 [Deltaproteobacteria bacterium]|nr:hypothetical protein [Deltaproteobacteria bacterium]